MTPDDGEAEGPSPRLRVAFVGKGGAGKSLIVGTFARLLGRRGEPVLILDSDPMPGLAVSLGMELADAPIPDEAVEEGPEDGPRFVLRTSADEAVERYAATGPDGVRLLQLGKLHGHASALIRSQFAFRQITEGLEDGRWHLIGDLPGGTRQPFFGWGHYADTFLVVIEPTAKGLLSAKRLLRLADAEDGPHMFAVANKVRDDDDVDRIARRTGLDVIAAVPDDDAVVEAERGGLAVVDHAPESPTVRAVESLVGRLLGEDAG